ncbi:MAG TPA: ABC transporter permease [Pyrinomonadaceae bacterium]
MRAFAQDLIKDVRYGLRTLLKSPGFTAVVILTFALGVGANTAIFSLVDAILLRPLPFADADRLMMVWEINPQKGSKQFNASGPNFVDWKSQSAAFESLSAYQTKSYALTNVPVPERVRAATVSANLFDTLKARAAVGRTFLEGEDRPGSDSVAVISHELWRRTFNTDPQVEGRAITLNGRSYTVVGVMPPGFEFPPAADRAALWIPLDLVANNLERSSHQTQVIGRLKPGVTEQQAQTELDTIAGRLEQQYPESNKGWRTRVVSLHENLVKDVKQSLYLLFGAVGLVLLIACTNVANLLLAKAATRQGEMALRTALGAGRGRLIRQLLTESVLLAVVGSLLGLLLAYLIINLLITLSPPDIPRLRDAGIDTRVMAFTLLVSVLTGLGFGLAPALKASRQDLSGAMKGGVRTAVVVRRSRARSLLVVAEVALSIVLLAGAGLLVKSLVRLQEVKPGFKADNLLTLRIALPDYRYTEESQWSSTFQEILGRVKNLPGVQSAGAISMLPLTGENLIFDITRDGQPPAPGEPKSSANFRAVDSEYFGTMGIPVTAGRSFTERDAAQAPKVVVINETMAKRFWPQENPVGKRITIGYGQPVPREIVGVVGDVRQAALDADVQAELYVPYVQTPMPFMSVVVRTPGGEPTDIVPAVRNQVAAVDKDLPIYGVRSMREVVANSLGQSRFRTVVLVVFAGLALVLAMLGVYGVLSYLVTERRHEIGIRMALGARQSNVIMLVVGRGMTLTALGLGVGLLITFWLSPIIVGLLYGVGSNDPLTLAGVSALLLLTALLACYVPARRASRISPLTAIRHE